MDDRAAALAPLAHTKAGLSGNSSQPTGIETG